MSQIMQMCDFCYEARNNTVEYECGHKLCAHCKNTVRRYSVAQRLPIPRGCCGMSIYCVSLSVSISDT